MADNDKVPEEKSEFISYVSNFERYIRELIGGTLKRIDDADDRAFATTVGDACIHIAANLNKECSALYRNVEGDVRSRLDMAESVGGIGGDEDVEPLVLHEQDEQDAQKQGSVRKPVPGRRAGPVDEEPEDDRRGDAQPPLQGGFSGLSLKLATDQLVDGASLLGVQRGQPLVALGVGL